MKQKSAFHATSEKPSNPDAVLEVLGLGHEYGDLVALAPLDLAVEPGELVALVGPNGAGKTTFLTVVAGLLEPFSGRVNVAGAPAGSLAARAATSYVPDVPVLYDDLSLIEHLEYIARLHGVEEWQPRADELLEDLGMEKWGDSLPSEFSRGMRQKASLALGLVRPFSLLLADEPFDGLDAESRSALFKLLDDARATGAAVIVSTHRSEVVESATRCVALRDGTLAYDGAPDPEVIADFVKGA